MPDSERVTIEFPHVDSLSHVVETNTTDPHDAVVDDNDGKDVSLVNGQGEKEKDVDVGGDAEVSSGQPVLR